MTNCMYKHISCFTYIKKYKKTNCNIIEKKKILPFYKLVSDKSFFCEKNQAMIIISC